MSSTFTLRADVRGYATKSFRYAIGVEQTYLPARNDGRFKVRFGMSIILNLLNLKF